MATRKVAEVTEEVKTETVTEEVKTETTKKPTRSRATKKPTETKSEETPIEEVKEEVKVETTPIVEEVKPEETKVEETPIEVTPVVEETKPEVVEIKETPEVKESKPEVKSEEQVLFRAQVGCYKNPADAQKVVAQLKSKGLSGSIEFNGTNYRVISGTYLDKQDAFTRMTKLKLIGFRNAVVSSRIKQ